MSGADVAIEKMPSESDSEDDLLEQSYKWNVPTWMLVKQEEMHTKKSREVDFSEW